MPWILTRLESRPLSESRGPPANVFLFFGRREQKRAWLPAILGTSEPIQPDQAAAPDRVVWRQPPTAVALLVASSECAFSLWPSCTPCCFKRSYFQKGRRLSIKSLV